MLLVNLIGGLGNQMFQYAFGKSLSMQRGIPVKFDLAELLDRNYKKDFTFRDFELGIFEAQVAVASKNELDLFKCQPTTILERVKYKITRELKHPEYYAEKQDFVFDQKTTTTSANTYFNGYWQNEKYFLPCEAVIRQDFSFKAPLSGKNAELAAKIAQTTAVSIHVRRGDYITIAKSNQVHGVCSIDYYQRAVAFIKERVSNPTLFVFSDDPHWVKENLLFDIPVVYVSHNTGSSSYEDMRLMSLCRHNIIANSSFSWWGAWLNANPTKIVIAPQQWLQKEQAPGAEIIPGTWVKL